MAAAEFIKAMPKIDLNVQLEGAFKRETLLMIAEQNNIRGENKKFDQWVHLLDEPDYDRLDEIAHTASSWVRYPEDVAHIVYDLGVVLSKQNVRYAEVTVLPSIYTDNGMSFEVLADALYDGADRAQRAWNIRMNWILGIPRDRPRKGDDIARWATSAAAKKINVVALALVGKENAQPIGQFRRAFATAEKKLLDRVVQANFYEHDETEAVLSELFPTRLFDGTGIVEQPSIIDQLIDQDIPIVINMARELRLGMIDSYDQHSFRKLHDAKVVLMLGSGMPSLYKSTLTEQYVALNEDLNLGLDEIQTIALNAVNYCFLPADEKAEMLTTFLDAFAELTSHIQTSEESED